MEKMPFRDAQSVSDVQAVIAAAPGGDDVDRLAAVAAGPDRIAGDAARAAR